MLETEVLIIGAGPVGQMSALLLSHHGISSTIVDRREKRTSAPKAHAVNSRTLEICESVGLSAETVRAIGAPADEAGWVRFLSKLNGVEFGHLPYERQQDDVKDLTPYPLSNIAQPDFEAFLAKALQDRSDVDLMRGYDCVDLDEVSDGVSATLRSRTTDIQVKARYVIAADGASSRTRERLGIALDGPEDLQHNMMIHFNADLRPLTAERPGILHFLFDPDCSGVLIAYDQGKNWVLMHGFDPATQTIDDFDKPRCAALVENAVGQKLPDLQIVNVGPWSMCAQVAGQYRKGRVFLAGDAAHRFPPTGGLGLNTGIGDAQNVAWKISAVLKGQADATLLDTYEVERRPVAQMNSEQSLENAGKLFELFGVLYGLDAEATRTHFDAMCGADERSPQLAAAVEAQRPHFDSLNLQLGYRYNSSAIIDPAPPLDSEGLDISTYVPSYVPGAYFPHRWVTAHGVEKSILSLLSANNFTLIAGPDGQGWRNAVSPCKQDVECLVEGEDYQHLTFNWPSATGLSSDAALLVRPDGHIAARLGALSDTRAADLQTALGQILTSP
jgi:2,4-dichlorophenol 6-monooxygenase